MTIRHNDSKHICHDCTGDQFLADEVRGQGTVRSCSYCGQTAKTIAIQDLAERVREVLEEHFERPSDYSEGPYEDYLAREAGLEHLGDTLDMVIAGMAGWNGGVVGDVVSHLPNLDSYRAVKSGGEDPYSPEAIYVERAPDDLAFHETWYEFGRQVRWRSRFINAEAEQALNKILGDLTIYKAWPDKPVVRSMGPDDEDRFIWRARTAQSAKELKDILGSPEREIGPPPPDLAKSGRMNAHGIPVFYGAMDESTCVAEVRAPVGSNVVVARFELLRDVRLLDLDALAKVYVGGSYFDPKYAERKGHLSFLRQLVREISRPVMPQDETFQYLTTQVVAEYLANKATPRLDGIVFNSSQSRGDGRNLVLFNHARVVTPHNDLPAGTKVDVYVLSAGEDEDDKGISIRETMPLATTEEVPTAISREDLYDRLLAFDEPPYGDPHYNSYDFQPTLRLDRKCLAVLYVESVEYQTRPRIVRRYQKTAEATDQTVEDS